MSAYEEMDIIEQFILYNVMNWIINIPMWVNYKNIVWMILCAIVRLIRESVGQYNYGTCITLKIFPLALILSQDIIHPIYFI